MAKPGLPNVYSSGWHLRQSLRHRETGTNAFVGNENLLSNTSYHYISGLLGHGAALTAFTINGYKRLNANPPGAEPQTNIVCKGGLDIRSSLDTTCATP